MNFQFQAEFFLQKVAQKIEQKTAQQAHMIINQYLITKGIETTPPNPNSRRANENAKNHPPTRNRSLRPLHQKRLHPRGYRCHYGREVEDSVLGYEGRAQAHHQSKVAKYRTSNVPVLEQAIRWCLFGLEVVFIRAEVVFICAEVVFICAEVVFICAEVVFILARGGVHPR